METHRIVVNGESMHADLVYSPDDGGWYWQRHLDDRTSQIFSTHDAAVEANLTLGIRWEP